MDTAEIVYAGLEPIGAASADPITARVCAAVGTDDPLIPTAQHDAFRTEMVTRDADHVLEVFEGVGNCFTNRPVDALGIPNSHDRNTELETARTN